MSGRIQKAIETEAEKTGMVKTKRRRGKERDRKKMRRKSKTKEKEAEEGKDDRCKESSRGVGDLG